MKGQLINVCIEFTTILLFANFDLDLSTLTLRSKRFSLWLPYISVARPDDEDTLIVLSITLSQMDKFIHRQVLIKNMYMYICIVRDEQVH